MQRFMVLLATWLLFTPIIIDEVTYNAIIQSARQSMRVPEFEVLANTFQQLEQRAEQAQAPAAKAAPAPSEGKK